jgi:hypothetical protein
MRHANLLGGAFAVAIEVLVTGPVWAAEWPDDCQEATLPSDDPNYPHAQLILPCLPPDFNGTLIIYAHGYVNPRSPSLCRRNLARPTCGSWSSSRWTRHPAPAPAGPG